MTPSPTGKQQRRSLCALVYFLLVALSWAPRIPLFCTERNHASLRSGNSRSHSPRDARIGRPQATRCFSKQVRASGSIAEASVPVPMAISAWTAVSLLVSIKCAADLATSFVARPPAAATALVSELAAFPITFAVLLGANAFARLRRTIKQESGTDVLPHDFRAIAQEAISDRPFSLMPLGFIWAFDQLLYFFALSNLGVVTYTVLAQTKIFFTVAFLRQRGLVSKLSRLQKFSFVMLFVGATLVALREVPMGVVAKGGNRGLGAVAVLVGHVMTCWANVKFEARLREPSGSPWARHLQVLFSISLALAMTGATQTAVNVLRGGHLPSMAATAVAFSKPGVWIVVALKAMSVVCIALTLRVGGNVLFAVSKPWPVILVTVVTCIARGALPPVQFVLGVVLSVAGIWTYYGTQRS